MNLGIGALAMLAVLTIGLGANGNLGRYCHMLWVLTLLGMGVMWGCHRLGEAALADRPEWQASAGVPHAAPRINLAGGRDMTPGILVTPTR